MFVLFSSLSSLLLLLSLLSNLDARELGLTLSNRPLVLGSIIVYLSLLLSLVL